MAKASTKIFTFLWYAKEAEEAAKFYASIFPDSRVDRVTPMWSESPSGPPIVVLCDDQEELDRYWDRLLEGGGEPQACGWLTDRYGLRWQIVPARLEEMMADTDRARSKRATDAMMTMVKLDIAALEKAYRG
jgi:predicted 3-demethylubiquinone-9 3-methyltransferase (glyoxalase superfamily)